MNAVNGVKSHEWDLGMRRNDEIIQVWNEMDLPKGEE
jgi:hypothetical protein